MPTKKIGASAGFTLRNVGGVVIVGGNCFSAAEIADCTSSAAASMSRSSVNCNVIWVWPMPLCEVIESSDGIVENCFSSGVATAVAIVSGEAPGRTAVTWIVGKSTFGKSDTGNCRYAAMPNTRMPIMTSVVMTGRRTKISETDVIAGGPYFAAVCSTILTLSLI